MSQKEVKEKQSSLEQLASRGTKKRAKRLARYQKNQAFLAEKNERYQKKLDQKRLFLHFSAWYNWRYVFLFGTVVVLGFLLPLYFMFSGMGVSDAVNVKPFLTISVAAFILFTVLYIWSVFKVRSDVLKEHQWMGQLPFALRGYPDLLIYRSYPLFTITLQFEDHVPERQFVLNVLETLPYQSRLISTPEINDSPKDKTMSFEVSNSNASKFNRHRRWSSEWLHKATDNHLEALHSKYPINAIILEDGKSVIDYDWWKPVGGFKTFLF